MKNTAGEKQVVGLKESKRALLKGQVKKLIIAEDAQDHVIEPLLQIAQQNSVEVFYVDSMKALGKQYGIGLKAAAVAILKDVVDETPL